MFEKNDKALRTSRIIIIVFICIVAVASLVMGIVLSVVLENAIYMLVTLAGWFLCWISWIFTRLYLSYLVDVKLIRNKLYNENNDGLEVFLSDKEERSKRPVKQKTKQAVNKELEYLQKLLNSGAITLEEYEERAEELTKE